MQENDGKSLSGNQGSSPVEAGNLQRRRLTRRTLIRHGLIAGGALIAATYVKPDLQSIRIPRAFAAGTQFIEGCTPGFWKTHFPGGWPATYQANPEFSSTFVVPTVYVDSLGPGKTLLDVLKQGGPCEKALGRHSVAALLNAAALGASFGKSTLEVVSETNVALATGNCATIEVKKNEFDALNNGSCLDGGSIADP